MNADLKRKWVEALRSGKYQQANGELREGDARFCCLGVLCEVAGVARIETDCGYDFGDPVQGDEAMLFGDFADSVGASAFQSVAARMNDDGKSFTEIADWIEKAVPES